MPTSRIVSMFCGLLSLTATHADTASDDSASFMTPELVADVLKLPPSLSMPPSTTMTELDWPEHRNYLLGALRNLAVSNIAEAAEQIVLNNSALPKPDPKYGFFRFIPQYVGSLTASSPTLLFPNRCFRKNNVSVAMSSTSTTTEASITFDFDDKISLLDVCSDTYLLATVDSIARVTLSSLVGAGKKSIHWNSTAATGREKTAIEWDFEHKGIRIFRFITEKAVVWEDIAKTATLFVSEAVNPVPAETNKVNMEFLNDYTPFHIGARNSPTINFDPSEVRSGDFFGILRLDGLDPMLAWAMGSSTGHTTVALWNRTVSPPELLVCESTAKDVYWPVNGVQCTPYYTWIAQAEKAGYNIVLLPISDEASANFDEVKALAWVESVIGLNYGYHVMFWSWIDTLKNNYPCTAPDFANTDKSTCFGWELLEVLVPLVDKLIPGLGFGQLFFKEAFAHRLDVADTMWNASMPEIYYQAGQMDVAMDTVPTKIEMDKWRYHSMRYNTTVTNAKSMVCCVFVCNMWKEAGVFSPVDNNVQCGEFTNLDAYSLEIFTVQNITNRPKKCIAADPTNNRCQIMGTHTLQLNRVDSKKMFPHMAEKCPSLPGCNHTWECPDQPPLC